MKIGVLGNFFPASTWRFEFFSRIGVLALNRGNLYLGGGITGNRDWLAFFWASEEAAL